MFLRQGIAAFLLCHFHRFTEVNLLSHYYIDHAHPSAYFKLGLLLPDLVPGFNQKMRRAVFTHVATTGEYFDLHAGIQKHFKVDAVFHNLEVFTFFCRQVSALLNAEQFPSFQKRKYFMAHIFTEKLIDRVLAKHSPAVCVNMRSDLEAVEAGVLTSYFSRIGKPAIQQEFFDNFKRLYSGTLLHFNSDNEMFGKALIRVYRQVNPVKPSRKEAENLISIAEAVETNHRAALLGVFDTVKERLAANAKTN